MLWNDRRTPPDQITDVPTGAPATHKRGFDSAHESMKRAAASMASTTTAKASKPRRMTGKPGR